MKVISSLDIDLDALVLALKDGKTIVYPTETAYGLGCDATNQNAVDRIFEIKRRQKDKPVLVVVPDECMAREYIEWNDKTEELAQKYWPGPMTLVAHTKIGVNLARGVMSSDGTAAFRVVDHPIASALAEKLGRPLVSTSANLSSYASPYSIEEVLEMFKNQEVQPDIVIDAGELISKNLSTVVKVVGGRVEVLRQGELIVE
ncbi:threonylcarbamoyl-AMP synthase [Patescibacteria group bacterium]|nr:threonylcarbamoyl-AMP synthase [Patescibacteria group bacterium]MBU1895655.1 threonylcarbamoyl-AMP synthase [Patescibacteria group bacterium]